LYEEGHSAEEAYYFERVKKKKKTRSRDTTMMCDAAYVKA